MFRGVVLNAWTALEALSPQTFTRPEDLTAGDRYRIARLEDGVMPWEGAGERSRPKKRLYYQVVLGEIDLPAAYTALLHRFADSAPDRAPFKGRAVLAVVVCDQKGRPALDSVAVSSFGWALPIALSGNLGRLGDWRTEERRLLEALTRRLSPTDDTEGLAYRQLEAAFQWLVNQLGLEKKFAQGPTFAVREYHPLFVAEAPTPLVLNSFFLGDLARARGAFDASAVPGALQRYLGMTRPGSRHDILCEPESLRRMLRPSVTPPGRWPGPGRASLVALQQAAVNSATSSALGDVIAVNGPPGTGKTTLLRDIVAAVVTARAEVLESFADPATAFSPSGVRFTKAGAPVTPFRLSSRLRGFELVVASSNNKAVENISAELPGVRAVAGDAPDLRYFPSVASALRGEECWGLIAAVLGNASNRYEFQKTFWDDPDVGLASYLAAAGGVPRRIEDSNGASRVPRVVELERPPAGHAEALIRWQAARARFGSALIASREMLASLQRVHELESQILTLQSQIESLSRQFTELEQSVVAMVLVIRGADAQVARDAARRDELEAENQGLRNRRPGLFARLFRTSDAQSWAAENRDLRARIAAVDKEVGRSRELAQEARNRHEEENRKLQGLNASVVQHSKALEDARRRHVAIHGRLAVPTGLDLLSADHVKRHLSTVWLDAKAQRLRDEVFVAAIALHRAFIDAAAAPLWHNLSGLMREMWTGVPNADAELIRDLWASFFLVVPLASTTFASVETMFSSLKNIPLGWLLIDEAGQATPQAAVGAVMRSERIVVVGDPMQVEPVVGLPDSLTAAICSRLGVDAASCCAPAASVQTLADRSSPLVATFASGARARTVGIPLLVHRRCAEPMFGISNQVAYEHLMVNAKAPRESRIGSILGPSRWLHVEGQAVSHWCEEEGVVLLDMLRKIENGHAPLDLYVVTPFRAVMQEARELVRRSGVIRSMDGASFCRERIGTIHTVQGREAEAVIFLLGSPESRQSGARAWAGARPNLLNVAVTRAKERLYVVGNRRLWRAAGCFQVLDERLSG